MLSSPALARFPRGAYTNGTPATAITLTPIFQNQVFQRAIASTSGPVRMSGTYSGGVLTGVEAQVLRASDNAVIVNWTALSSAVIGSGNWSGTLLGVPQGATAATQYYAKVRCANATAVTATGGTQWAVGYVVLLYGQSNGGKFFGQAQTPFVTPNAGSYFFDSTLTSVSWDTSALGNGVMTYVNGLISRLGCPVAAVNGCIPAVGIGYLADPAQGYGRLINGIPGINVGILAGGVYDCEEWLWMQGEGNADTIGTRAYYEAQFTQLQTQLCTQFGRTTAQFPCMIWSLATVNDPAAYININWSRMSSIQYDYGYQRPLPNVTFSHSMKDAVLNVGDPIHIDGLSCQAGANRFLRTWDYLHAGGSAPAHFEITGATTVDATHTTITVTLNGGATDISPSSGITGFEVSGDNGATWAAPSAAVRASATTVTLTHGSLSTTNTRLVRYQWGILPDVTAPLRDNSALALPVTYSQIGDIIPTALSTVPVPKWQINQSDDPPTSGGGGITQEFTAEIFNPITQALVILTLTGAGGDTTVPTITLTPNVGSPVVMTQIVGNIASGGAGQPTGIYQAVLGADANAATSWTITAVYPSNPFGGSVIGLWAIPSASLNSTTPTGSGSGSSSSGNSCSVNINVSAGGFIIAAGASADGTSGNLGTIAATGSTAQRKQQTSYTRGDASNLSASASSNVSITFVNTGATRISAVAYR